MIDNNSLHFAIANGIIDEDELRLQIEMYEREHYLSLHKFKIWQGPSGEWFTYLPDPRKEKGRRMIKRRKLESLEDDISNWYREWVDEPTISTVFKEWVDQKIYYGEIKKQTYDKYVGDYNRYFKGKDIELLFFRHITEDILKHFIRSLIRNNQLTAKGWANARTLINGIFKYGKEKGYTTLSISWFMGDLMLSKNMFKKRTFHPEESVFTSEEIDMIEKYIYSEEPSLLNYGILLGFETGLRVGEISGLKLSDFDLDASVAFICRKETRCKNNEGHTIFYIEDFTKGRDGSRLIILTEEAIKIIKQCRRLNPFGEYLFTSPNTGERIHGTYFSQKLIRICDKIGIKKRSMHKARKTYATRLFNGNVDETIIMNQMGHTDIATTRKHYLFNSRTNAEAIAQVKSALGKNKPLLHQKQA